MIRIFHFFITNTQVDKIPQNVDLFYSFSNDMKYDLNYGDMSINQVDQNQVDMFYLKFYLINTYNNNNNPNQGVH